MLAMLGVVARGDGDVSLGLCCVGHGGMSRAARSLGKSCRESWSKLEVDWSRVEE